MTANNQELRSFLEELNIIGNIKLTLEGFFKNVAFRPSLLASFAIFLSYYFCTKPYLDFTQVK